MKTTQLARYLALGAGVMDLGTGLGLVFAPSLTLGLMGVGTPDAGGLPLMRWIGAFVGAVGASYLLALSRRSPVALREVLVTTLLFRAAAGLYSGAAVLSGALEPRWLAVTATDLGLVVAQVWLLRRGGWAEHE